jgi:hypothetical protein
MTIAEQLNITKFPFIIKDEKGNELYSERSDGYWQKCEYDSHGIIYFEDSIGYWCKREFDSNGNLIHFENSNGYWEKCEYDSKNRLIYWKNSHLVDIEIDERPKVMEYTLDEIAKALGVDAENIRIKK